MVLQFLTHYDNILDWVAYDNRNLFLTMLKNSKIKALAGSVSRKGPPLIDGRLLPWPHRWEPSLASFKITLVSFIRTEWR